MPALPLGRDRAAYKNQLQIQLKELFGSAKPQTLLELNKGSLEKVYFFADNAT